MRRMREGGREGQAVGNNVKTKKRRKEGDARKTMMKMGFRMRLM
jgi:hypothetical protein